MTHDYLRWCLTGVKGLEVRATSPSPTSDNMATGQYDPRLTERLGISEIDSALPPWWVQPKYAGRSRQAAAITGLAAGTPVVGGLFDAVSTALRRYWRMNRPLNAVMGTAVTSGIAHGLRDQRGPPLRLWPLRQHGQYIVHEASPDPSATLNVYRPVGRPLYEINRAVASLLAPVATSFFFRRFYGSNAGLEMTCILRHAGAAHRAHLLQVCLPMKACLQPYDPPQPHA